MGEEHYAPELVHDLAANSEHNDETDKLDLIEVANVSFVHPSIYFWC